MLTGLRLELVTQQNVRAACGLKVRPDQEGLVAPVAFSLADAYTVPDVAWPRLIYEGDQVVGFVMAAFAPEHQDPVYHSYLWRLNIGAEHQGKGVGRFAVQSLCQEAARCGHQRLSVSYHVGQHGPEGFYRRLGFQPTGAYIQDEEVAERLISPTKTVGSEQGSLLARLLGKRPVATLVRLTSLRLPGAAERDGLQAARPPRRRPGATARSAAALTKNG